MNIFPIGDSITVGATDEVTAVGYPLLLCNAASYGTKGFWQESPARYANGGYDILDVQNGIDAALTARSTTPTHVLILIGSNDIADLHWGLFNETTWKADYQYVIDAIHTKWANAKIYLGKSYRDGDGYIVKLETLAGWIDDLVAANPGVCFAGIDSRTIYTGNEATLLVDDVHPNHAGFIAMADAWKTILGY